MTESYNKFASSTNEIIGKLAWITEKLKNPAHQSMR